MITSYEQVVMVGRIMAGLGKLKEEDQLVIKEGGHCKLSPKARVAINITEEMTGISSPAIRTHGDRYSMDYNLKVIQEWVDLIRWWLGVLDTEVR